MDLIEEAIVDAQKARKLAQQQATQDLIEENKKKFEQKYNDYLHQEQDDELGMGFDDGNADADPGLEFNDDLDFSEDPMAGGETADDFLSDQIPQAYAEEEKLCPCPDDDEEIEIDFDQLISQAEKEDGDSSDLVDREENALEMGDEMPAPEPEMGDEEEGDYLQELEDILEIDDDILEEFTADVDGTESGYSPRPDEEFEEEWERLIARELSDDPDPKFKQTHDVERDDEKPKKKMQEKGDDREWNHPRNKEMYEKMVGFDEAKEESADLDDAINLASDIMDRVPDYAKGDMKKLIGKLGELEGDRKGDQSGEQEMKGKRDRYNPHDVYESEKFMQALKEKMLEEIGPLHESIKELEEQNKKLRKRNEKERKEFKESLGELNEALKESNVLALKQTYKNRALQDSSLNGRQKNKLVEMLSVATDVDEIEKVWNLREGLESSSNRKEQRNPLQEALANKSNFSSTVRSQLRENRDREQSEDSHPLKGRWQEIAGIKKD